MKRLLLILCCSGLLVACDQKVGIDFASRDGIYFDYYYKYLIYTIEFDSVNFSFGLIPDEVKEDTAKLAVKVLGTVSDRDRYYRVVIDTDSTTAVEGVHYRKVDELQLFRAGRLVDTLKVVLLRDALSSSHITQEHKQLYFRIEESEDFTIGLKKGLNKRLVVNNYLSEPKWWAQFPRDLYYYHPEKWKVLISFDEKFANYESIPYDMNTGLRQYITSLTQYLNDNNVYDQETGALVKMYELIPKE